MAPHILAQDSAPPRRLLVSAVGELRIETSEHEPIRFVGKKGLALIVFLAMRPGLSASRGRLCEILWSDAENSRSNLRQTLLLVRRTLLAQGVDVLLTEQDSVALRSDAVECDVRLIERALAEDSLDRLEAAAALCTGPFLDGFFAGSPAFDDWAAAERERVGDLAVAVLERLARRTSGEARLGYARRLLAFDPLREASYRVAMEVMAAQGDRDQALRLFETCRSVLRKELDVEPSRETRALREAILAARADSQPAPAGGAEETHTAESRPAIVLRPFSTLANGEAEDALARALSRDLVTALSEHRDYTVYEEMSRLPGQAAAHDTRGSRARFLVSGSVQASAGLLRVSVQLAEVTTGEIVWAQRFDGTSAELISFQDKITQSVTLAVRLELQLIGYSIHDRSPPGPPEVRRLVNQALTHYYRMTRESLSTAVKLSGEALAIDPGNARAARTLSVSSTVSVVFGAMRRTPALISRALELAQFAVRSVPDDEMSRVVLSYALLAADRREEAVAELHHALSLNPHYPSAHGDLAEIYALEGRTDEALRLVQQSVRLSSGDPTTFWRNHTVAIAKFAAGDDWAALEMARKVVRSKPDFLLAAVYWAAAAAATGTMAEAARAIDHCLSCIPDLTVATVSPGLALRYGQHRHQERFLDMLAKAGLPP